MSVEDPWVLGIDFGTSFTVAAARSRRGSEVIEVGGERRVPSVVLAEDDGTVVVGRSAENLATSQPGRAIRAPKSRLSEPAPVILGGRPHQVTDLIASLLSYVYLEAVRQQGSPPVEVRLTHPASWSQPRLDRLVTAAAKAQLPSPVLVPEPVAAAVSFADEGGIVDGGYVAVYDLGGGTFDTAVLQATDDGFVVVGRPAGEDRLGGDLFDELLANYVGERLDPQTWEALQVSDERAWQQAAAGLRSEARRVKEALSSHPYAELLLGLPTGMVTQRVTRDEFEALVKPYVTSSVDLLSRAVGDAGLDAAHLDAVYLAGGASRSPVVERLVSQAFPGVTVSRRGDPKTAVALGATHGKAVTSAAARASNPPVAPVSGPPVSGPPVAPVSGPPVAPVANPPMSFPPAAPGSLPPGSYPPPAAPTVTPAPAPYGAAPASAPAGYGPGSHPAAPPPSWPPTGQPAAPNYGAPNYGGAQHGGPTYGGAPQQLVGGRPPGRGDGGGSKLGLIVAGVAAVVILLVGGGFVLLRSGGQGETAADRTTTTRDRSETTRERSSTTDEPVTSIFPPTLPLITTTTLAGTTPTVAQVSGPATAEQVAAARLSTAEVGIDFVAADYGPDEPYCGIPVQITSLQRANVAYENASTAVRVDNDVQAFADEATAAADLEKARSLVNTCPVTSTTVEGVEYLIGLLPYPDTPVWCDETFVALQVATPYGAGLSISRAVGGIRCGRNVVSVGYAVLGRDFSDADAATFATLMQIASSKLAGLPR